MRTDPALSREHPASGWRQDSAQVTRPGLHQNQPARTSESGPLEPRACPSRRPTAGLPRVSRGRVRRPAPRAPPKARTRAYRLRDAAPDRMSAADWPGQNSSPKAEADGQDAAPSSRQTTPSAAMAPGGHAVPATLLCPGSANPLVPAERVTCNHGNAAAPPRACVLRHPSQAVSWAERAEAGAWGRGMGRSRGGALAWGGALRAGPGVCGRGRPGRQSPVCGPRLCGLRSRGRVPLGPCRQVPGLAPDPEPHTVTHPLPVPGARSVLRPLHRCL